MFSVGGHTIVPTELKFGIEVNPREVIGFILFWYPNPQGQGTLKNDFAVGWRFAVGLEFTAGVENALGKAGYPC